MQDLLNDFEAMIHRAERNHQLFSGVAWEAHKETLEVSELPHLLEKRADIETNMALFADSPDELERLRDCLEMVTREIAYLQDKRAKQDKKRGSREQV